MTSDEEYERLVLATMAALKRLAAIVGGEIEGPGQSLAGAEPPRILLAGGCAAEFPDWPTGLPADDPAFLGGHRLIGFRPGPAAWRVGLAISAAQAGNDGLAREIMARESITAEQTDAAAGHFLNGRVAAAREMLGL